MKNRSIIQIFTLAALFVTSSLQAQKGWTLEECLNYSWENSTTITRAENSKEISQINYNQAQSNRGASLNASIGNSNGYGWDYNGANDSWNGEAYSSLNSSLNSSITLYNGAKLKNYVKQNALYLDASEADVQYEMDNLGLLIMRDYINVLLSRQQLYTAQQQLETTAEQLNLAEERKQIGLISIADLLDMKSQYASNKATLAMQENSLKINYVYLMQDMNMPVDTGFRIFDPNISQLIGTLDKYNPTTVFNVALGIRPEVKSAELSLSGSAFSSAIAKADYFPRLSMNAGIASNYNTASNYNFGIQYGNTVSPTIGFTLAIPIYQKKAVKNSVARAEIEQNNAELQLVDTKNWLRKAIEQAVVDANSAQITLEALNEQCMAEQASYEVAEEKFNQGLLSTVDYLIRKNALFNAKSERNRAEYDLLLQRKVIDYYMGKSIVF